MNKTLGIIKPESVSANAIGGILSMVEQAGFRIEQLKMLRMSEQVAKDFYSVHKERHFYQQLVDYMTSGPVVVFAISAKDGVDAVESYRDLIGPTDSALAKEGTIRKRYGKDKEQNAVHGSDSAENAKKEIDFFFG